MSVNLDLPCLLRYASRASDVPVGGKVEAEVGAGGLVPRAEADHRRRDVRERDTA